VFEVREKKRGHRKGKITQPDKKVKEKLLVGDRGGGDYGGITRGQEKYRKRDWNWGGTSKGYWTGGGRKGEKKVPGGVGEGQRGGECGRGVSKKA